jgi:multidrug efflux pump subunit AcrB
MQVEDRSGRATPAQILAINDEIMADARKDPAPRADLLHLPRQHPQLYANVDRTRVKSQNVSDHRPVHHAQVYLGGFYVKDSTTSAELTASWPRRRAVPRQGSDIAQLKTRNADGQMVPLGR